MVVAGVKGAGAELPRPEAGIREFGAGLAVEAFRRAVGGAEDAANRITRPWAGSWTSGQGFESQMGPSVAKGGDPCFGSQEAGLRA